MVRKKSSKFLSYFLVVLVALIVILPFLWMIVSAFKSQRELFAWPPNFFPKN